MPPTARVYPILCQPVQVYETKFWTSVGVEENPKKKPLDIRKKRELSHMLAGLVIGPGSQW